MKEPDITLGDGNRFGWIVTKDVTIAVFVRDDGGTEIRVSPVDSAVTYVEGSTMYGANDGYKLGQEVIVKTYQKK